MDEDTSPLEKISFELFCEVCLSPSWDRLSIHTHTSYVLVPTQIVTRLHPKDLLSLTRVNKFLRRTLRSRYSLGVVVQSFTDPRFCGQDGLQKVDLGEGL